MAIVFFVVFVILALVALAWVYLRDWYRATVVGSVAAVALIAFLLSYHPV